MILGMVVDLVIYESLYPGVPMEGIIEALLTLKIFPYATVTMTLAAFVALWVTYAFYDTIMLLGTDYHEVTAESQNAEEKQLYNVVEEMKVAAGLGFMPRVYIIEADYMNAFASGFSEKSAMLAITRGLLQKLDRSEMQAVMAHELSHIRHGDIKLTLVASVLTNIILIVVDLVFYNLVYGRRSRIDGRILIVVIALRYILPIFTTLLLLYLSRTREYMADAGAVELMRDNKPLASALIKISDDHEDNLEHYREEYGTTAHEDVRRAAYIYDPVPTGAEPVKSFSGLFSTHPTLAERLNALGFGPQKLS